MGQAFHFTHQGVQPLHAGLAGDPSAVHGLVIAAPPEAPTYDPEAIAAESAPRVVSLSSGPIVAARDKRPGAAPPAAVSPRSVIKAARARVKEIRAELRQMRALQKELGQLERMLTAAAKPLASLTQLNSRRVG